MGSKPLCEIAIHIAIASESIHTSFSADHPKSAQDVALRIPEDRQAMGMHPRHNWGISVYPMCFYMVSHFLTMT